MSDPLAKAEAIAAKHEARVASLRAEIARRQADPRSTKSLERAEAALPAAEDRVRAAAERVMVLRRKAATAAARAERAAAADAAMVRRLDHVAAAAPAVMKRWDKERKEEPKRIEKRRKQLARRVTKDHRSGGGEQVRAHFGTGRRASAPMPAEAETFPSGPIIPYVPPKIAVDRPGLLAGDYRLVDVSADNFDGDRIPERWTTAYVGQRLADAHATLRRLPMTTRPKEFGAIWPEYQHAAGELAVQAGAGTLHMGRGRVIGGTSAADLARMHEALAWPMTFLLESPAHARAVNEWAYDAADDGMVLTPFVEVALEHIARHLNAKGVTVT